MFKNKADKDVNGSIEMAGKIQNLTISRPSFTEKRRLSGMPRGSKRKSDIQSLISVGDVMEHNIDGAQDIQPLEQIEEEKGIIRFLKSI